MTKKVFIDASIFLSFIERDDTNHTLTVKLLEQFSLNEMVVYTSFLEVESTYFRLCQDMNVSLGLEFLQTMSSSTIEILFAQKSDFKATSKYLVENPNSSTSFGEVLNSLLMQKKGISQIFTLNFWHNLAGTKTYLAR